MISNQIGGITLSYNLTTADLVLDPSHEDITQADLPDLMTNFIEYTDDEQRRCWNSLNALFYYLTRVDDWDDDLDTWAKCLDTAMIWERG